MYEPELRRFVRVKTKSIIVTIESSGSEKPITGFVRDISEGGMKIQKISKELQVDLGIYNCRFVLPGLGKISTEIEIIGFGNETDKSSIRMKFIELAPELRDKIKQFTEKNQDESK